MLSLTKKQFLEMEVTYTHVPLYKKLAVDFDTPLSLFNKMKADFLLESVENETTVGRYSIIAKGKQTEFVLRGKSITTNEFNRTGEQTTSSQNNPNPLNIVHSYLARFKLPPVETNFVPFYGGLIGYLGYEAVQYFEKVPIYTASDIPDGILVMPDIMLIHDNFKHVAYLIRIAPTNGGEIEYQHTEKLFDELFEQLTAPTEIIPLSLNSNSDNQVSAKSNFPKDKFLQAVAKCIDYINSGEAVQVVLSQRFEIETQSSPLELYRRLRYLNPSPYLYYLRFDKFHLIGSSPEVMIRVENGEIILRPIAGTRPRGSTPTEDEQLASELLSDRKELAEHLMLVDLGRNDLGRIAQTGTVQVTDYMSVEKFSHVMHIVSTIKAKLRTDKNVFDAIAATFPAGTLSGAPKCRAMEIIAELEQTRRDTYGGMVLCLGFNDYLNSCITIRPMLLKDGIAYIQAGGGIVTDSVPQKEYEESVNKAKALFAAIKSS